MCHQFFVFRNIIVLAKLETLPFFDRGQYKALPVGCFQLNFFQRGLFQYIIQ